MKRAKIVAVANNKGGVGKTTTTFALAQLWAEKGYKILLVDLDSQANLSLLTSPIPLPEVLTIMDPLIHGTEPVVLKSSDNIDLIPSGLDLATFELDAAMLPDGDRIFLLANMLDRYQDKYDLIMIDCPPAIGLLTYNAFIISDYIILTSTADRLAYEGMYMILNFAKKIQSNRRLNPNMRVAGILITKFKKNKVNNAFAAQIKADIGDALIEPFIRETTKVQQAMAGCKSFLEYDPEGNATQDYKAVADVLEAKIFDKTK